MARKKIVQLIRSAQGGMREHLFSLIENMDREKFEFIAVGPFQKEDKERLERLGIKAYLLPLSPGINFVQDWWSIKELRSVLRIEKPQLLHMHGSKAALIGKLTTVFFPSIPCLFTIHNFILDNYPRRTQKLILGLLEKGLIMSCQKVITVSLALAENLIKTHHIPENKIIIIYNGVDYRTFQPGPPCPNLKKELGLPDNILIIGTVARLIKEKGIEQIIECSQIIKRLRKDVFFLIVGDGPHRSYLEKTVYDHRLDDRIIFIGYRKDIGELLKIMDIFVLPSLSEGLGIALLEAMAMEKPVIGTNVGGISEIIANEENGYLFPPGNINELAEKIVSLIEQPQKRQQFAIQGRKFIEEKFSLKEMIAKTEELYLNILK